MTNTLIPKTKTDLETAKKAVAAGYPAVEPVLGELVEWLQDYNWPVARILAPFLAEIGMPMVPCIDHVFSTNDGCWKYWMIECLIAHNEDLFQHYKQKLIQLTDNPTNSDRQNDLDEVARELLQARSASE